MSYGGKYCSCHPINGPGCYDCQLPDGSYMREKNQSETGLRSPAVRHQGRPLLGPLFVGVLSLCVPGLGQLLTGRFKAAVGWFVSAAVLWIVALGWIIHILSAFFAFRDRRRQ